MRWIEDLVAGATEAAKDARDPVVRESKRQDRVARRVADIEDNPNSRVARKLRDPR